MARSGEVCSCTPFPPHRFHGPTRLDRGRTARQRLRLDARRTNITEDFSYNLVRRPANDWLYF